MSDIHISPIEGSVADIKMVRGVTSHRLRENQPALNAPAQDSLPGPGSGDE